MASSGHDKKKRRQNSGEYLLLLGARKEGERKRDVSSRCGR